MKKRVHQPNTYLLIAAALSVVVLLVLLTSPRRPDLRTEDILPAYRDDADYPPLDILYPLDETLFPPEIVPPTFRWRDARSNVWLVRIEFQDSKEPMTFLANRPDWTPAMRLWEEIKRRSLEHDAHVTILGVRREQPKRILSAGRTSIRTSKDEVGAPLFYREVNLPFIEAVKDPTRIRWRFGSISSPKRPPIILENLPVCGNCHSFSSDGSTLAMDVDYANSKASYVITRVAQRMLLATSDIMTWNDYRPEEGKLTFGLLSQISPDGKVVVSTVKDRSVFVPKPGIEFSQLFFPIKGILAAYYRDKGIFQAVPGADDPRYVQSNPSWSPDGKYLVFARAEAYTLKHLSGGKEALLTPEECKEFLEEGKPFRYDLYRVPFNGGKGGEPQPLEGASNNGLSNYFARYSPDGKWIVFCRAKNYMLLQPDSELYIIPAEGGEARRLRCNTHRMNSWHSWSPNGRWLVFSSKANSAYTQLFLTHMDEEGHSTPPVSLAHLTAPDRAVNIPEFVNASPSAIRKIEEQFLDDYSYERAGNQYYRYGDADGAIPEYRKALQLNPNNARVHQKLGFLLYNVKGMTGEGMAHLAQAIRLDPGNARAHFDLGMALLHRSDFQLAERHLAQALLLVPNGIDDQYNPVDMRHNLALSLAHQNRFQEAIAYWSEALSFDPDDPEIHYRLAMALAARGDITDTLKHYNRAVKLQPDIDTSVGLHDRLAASYARAGNFTEAIRSANKAVELARAAGESEVALQIEQRIERYRQQRPPTTE